MAVKPIMPVALERKGEDGLTIRWSDGHESVYGFADLRHACPCASCRESRERPSSGLVILPGDGPQAVVPSQIEPVGRYAYTITWKDGHSTGIYSFDYLRQLCQCPRCR